MERHHAMLIVLSSLFLGVNPALAQPGGRELRLNEPTPELIVDTGARNAACDVLLFSPDGKHLLAAGDDKAVRIWPFDPVQGLDADNVQALRWASFREQRGSIYAMSLNRTGSRVAVTGYGRRNGAAAVLNRKGEVLHGVDRDHYPKTGPTPPPSLWAIAMSPSERQVALGGEDGSVWVWELQAKTMRRLGKHPGFQKGGKPANINRVRLLAYVGDDLISAAEDGWVCEWDPNARNEAEPGKRFRFQDEVGAVITATLDASKRWIAAGGGQHRKSGVVEVRSLDGKQGQLLELPLEGRERVFANALAFDPKAQQLLVGYFTLLEGATFHAIQGGGVKIFDLAREREVRSARLSSYPEAVAVHPAGEHFAVALAENFEVEVHPWADPRQRLSRVVGPGHSLWGAGLSRQGKLLVGFQTERAPTPPGPGKLGQGDWTVFDLERQNWAKPADAKSFEPVAPLEQSRQWRIQPDPKWDHIWHARTPDGELQQLELQAIDGRPNCFTFLPGLPVRVVIGHYWGMSVFQLGGEKPRLVRKFVGHQGRVTAVAPSRDGKLLVSASRDQTVCLWRLDSWANQSELGASFEVAGNQLTVKTIAKGSPAWEAGLEAGDTISNFRYKNQPVPGGAAAWRNILVAPEPGQPCEFHIPRKGVLFMTMTSVRQRPVLRFFPMQDREWMLWRYHDFYYATSTNGDFHVGWLLSRDVSHTPVFDRAEQYREKFHKPEKVRETVLNLAGAPERVHIQELEAPRVSIKREGTGAVEDGKDVMLALSVEPSGKEKTQSVASVRLWVNDRQYREWNRLAGSWEREKDDHYTTHIRVPASELRRGKNLITVQAFNSIDQSSKGRRDAILEVDLERAERKPNLHALVVGVGNYPQLRPLRAHKDAAGLALLWKGQKTRQFGEVELTVLTDSQATRAAILKAIQDLKDRVGPDDLFLLSLGGHGISDQELKKMHRDWERGERGGVEITEPIPTNTFVFCNYDYRKERPISTGLTSTQLYDAIRGLRCRKILLLDACHSGTVERDPIRSLTPHAVGPLIFSACAPSESALESTEPKGPLNLHGYFALALQAAAGPDFSRADRDRNQMLEARELAVFVREAVQQRVRDLNRSRSADDREVYEQTPQAFLPVREKSLPLIRK